MLSNLNITWRGLCFLCAGTLCFASGKPAKKWTYWGRSYWYYEFCFCKKLATGVVVVRSASAWWTNIYVAIMVLLIWTVVFFVLLRIVLSNLQQIPEAELFYFQASEWMEKKSAKLFFSSRSLVVRLFFPLFFWVRFGSPIILFPLSLFPFNM